ncbi:MAG: aminopeptidase N C-terminal domain-containing protein, partial [Pseudomonadota bacterium]
LVAAPVPGANDLSAEAAGRRALRNAALHLLAVGGDIEPAVEAAAIARTMTDRLAALSALNAAHAPEAEDALTAFHNTFRDEPLVLDKYFALQALRGDGDVLGRVKALMDHPAFSLANPNRTRSLIGAFSQNIPAFHGADGSGYRFVGDIAKTLDASNPQVAARLLTGFGDARRYDAQRRTAAHKVLEDIAASAKSSDVADIVRRLLAAAKG